MKIADLDFYLLSPTDGSADGIQRTLLVRVSTSDGQEGWGEARSKWRASELGSRRESLLPILTGRNVADVEELSEVNVLTSAALRAAVEMACWDLIGRVARQPLSRIWGGEYRPRVPVALRLPNTSPHRAAQLARDLHERGFHTQVVAGTGNLDHDLAVVDALRQATADRVKLRFDAAGRYPAETARELCHRLERAGLQFILDPL